MRCMQMNKLYRKLVFYGPAIFFSSLFAFGFGLSLHDFAHHLWQLGGIQEVIGLHGGYIGYVIMVIAFILLLVIGNSEGCD